MHQMVLPESSHGLVHHPSNIEHRSSTELVLIPESAHKYAWPSSMRSWCLSTKFVVAIVTLISLIAAERLRRSLRFRCQDILACESCATTCGIRPGMPVLWPLSPSQSSAFVRNHLMYFSLSIVAPRWGICISLQFLFQVCELVGTCSHLSMVEVLALPCSSGRVSWG